MPHPVHPKIYKLLMIKSCNKISLHSNSGKKNSDGEVSLKILFHFKQSYHNNDWKIF